MDPLDIPLPEKMIVRRRLEASAVLIGGVYVAAALALQANPKTADIGTSMLVSGALVGAILGATRILSGT